MNRAPHRIVDEFEARFASLESEFNRAYWESQAHASPENEHRREGLELQLRTLQGDGTVLAAVNDALTEGAHEPMLRRQLEVLRLELTENQMSDAQRQDLVRLSSEVESEFTRHRPRLDGEELDENKIADLLRTSDDAALRKRTYVASKEIGKRVGGRVRELARLRNAAALELGFADHFTMSLELQELSEDWLFKLFEELDSATRPIYSAWKADLDEGLRERFNTDELFPWHYSDPFAQHLPSQEITFDAELKGLSAADLATATFDRWGIDLRPVIERSDLFPRRLKSEEAFCLDVDRSGKDVRILANVVPGERWVHVMLHECGHAAYDVSLDKRLPYLLRQVSHTFVTEGVAILSERLGRDPYWLSQIAGLPEAQVNERARALKVASARQSVLFARWVLVVSHFERALYADPEGDLDEVWWDLVDRYQLIQRPDMELPGAWASKAHIAVAPVYYQNYLLGELVASQLEATLVERTGSLLNPDAGELLKNDFFRHGAKWRWDKTIEQATGRPLTPDFFAAQVSA